jgi:hypothetical protein
MIIMIIIQTWMACRDRNLGYPCNLYSVKYKRCALATDGVNRPLLRGDTTWTGDFKCREVKTGFYWKKWRQTGSSGTLIGWKSGQTSNHFCPSMGPNGGSVAMDSEKTDDHIQFSTVSILYSRVLLLTDEPLTSEPAVHKNCHNTDK